MSTPADTQAQPPDNHPGSAYPSPARQLAGRWSRRRESKGLRGLLGAMARSVHAWLVRVQIDQQRPDIRFVIMLGVMRSGSSVLSQILCSHPDIIGYGETHITYDGESGFIQLIKRNLWTRHAWRVRKARYFDKVLHAELIPDMTLLSQMPVDWIVLRRKGEPCVKSMIRTLDMSPEHACAHFEYQSGMIDSWVREIEQHPKARIVQVSYEDLVDDASSTLARLTDELGLNPVLREEYSVQKGVMRAGANDPSGNFLKGRVERITHDQKPLDAQLLERLLACDNRNENLAKRISARSVVNSNDTD